MTNSALRAIVKLLGLLGFALGAPSLVVVVTEEIPVSQGPAGQLAVIAGLTTVFAARIQATIPALAAGWITLGFLLAIIGQGVVDTIAALVTLLGVIGFLVSVGYLLGQQIYDITQF
jgi:fatty acid desaturase